MLLLPSGNGEDERVQEDEKIEKQNQQRAGPGGGEACGELQTDYEKRLAWDEDQLGFPRFTLISPGLVCL
jgi:hypothetical protein